MLTTVQARLKLLSDVGYLQSVQLPTVKSKSPYIYTLASRGVKYLTGEGLEVSVSYKPSEIAELSHSFLWHVLELNDFLILAQTLERSRPQYKIAALHHDLTLRKKPIRIPAATLGKTGKDKESVPDAFLDVRMSREGKKPLQWPLWVELDRGTEQTIDRFKEKLRRIIAALQSGACQHYFSITAEPGKVEPAL